MKIIAQERFVGNLATVFRQGNVQLSLETAKGFSVSPLSDDFDPCSVQFESGLFFLRGQNALAVFTADGKCALNEQVTSFQIESNTLSATLPLSDSRNRRAECSWALTEEGCFRTSFRIVETGEAGAEETVREELLPYAFFESVLIGADFAQMLNDELREKADHIRAFLGDFCSVTLTKDPATCGLVRKKKDRLYELRYFTAVVRDGKIADIRG